MFNDQLLALLVSMSHTLASYRYRIQYESLLQSEREQNEFIEDFGIK